MFLYLGRKVVMGDVAQAAQKAGFSGEDLLIAVSIAYAESRGDPNAVGDQTLAPERGPSIGLWQINIGSKAHPEWAGDNLTDPQTNANRAFELYQRAGGTFRDWSTFKFNRYQAFMDRARQEVNA